MKDSGSSTHRVMRVRSTHTLPMACAEWRAKPRTSATTTAMPVAAERKFCTVSPSIWVR
ncbi:hypothetical protein D3C85_1878980 [compost metagenome]